jgi:hypothetical protein
MVQGRKTIRRVAAWPQYHPEGSQQVERAQTQVGGVQIQADGVQTSSTQVQTSSTQVQTAAAQSQQLIFQTLNEQTGLLSGWQALVLIQERAGLIFNL